MLRLVERLFGEGHLHDSRAGAAPLAVACELEVYRDWQVTGSEFSPGPWVIEGHLMAPAEALARLAGRGDPFRLRMLDGRQLDVFVIDGDGRIVNVEGSGFTDAPDR